MVNRTNVIALTGATGCGKDSLAKQLTDSYGYAKLSFGKELRNLLYKQTGFCTDERALLFDNHTKCFKDLMLDLGQKLAIQSPDRLSNLLVAQLNTHVLREGGPVVITDVRKPVELRSLLQVLNLNLYFVEIVRTSNPYEVKRLDNLLPLGHTCETLPQPYRVCNDGSESDLLAELAAVLETKIPVYT